MIPFDYVEPTSIDEVVELLARHGDDAHLMAGGASLVLMLRQQLVAPRVVVGLRKVRELRGIQAGADGSLRIGATATHRQVERSAEVARYDPTLAEAFGRIATVRIRNQGTIGGNLAHGDPAQDPPPILLALDAVVHAAGETGAREIAIGDLFVDYFETSLGPTEVITGVSLPPRPLGASSVYTKYLPGSKDDYATVAVAVSATRTDDGWRRVRIACGAAGPIPLRIHGAEQVAEGSDLDETTIERAAEAVAAAVDPIADIRGSAEYKRDMAAVWTARTLRRLAARGGDRSRLAS